MKFKTIESLVFNVVKYVCILTFQISLPIFLAFINLNITASSPVPFRCNLHELNCKNNIKVLLGFGASTYQSYQRVAKYSNILKTLGIPPSYISVVIV